MEMLKAGVRALVPGEIPSDSAKLAQICGIDETKVIDHWEALTHGWILTSDGNLYHDGVANYCALLIARFGDKIDEIQMRIADLEGGVLMAGSIESKVTKKAVGKSAQAANSGRPVFGSAKSRSPMAAVRHASSGKGRAP